MTVKTTLIMVSRRSTQSVTQRSTRQSELHMTRRPRRLLTPKTLDDTVGLSRKEERELKKALYASLQESRRPRTPLLDDDSKSSYKKEVPQLRKSTRHVPARASFPSPESKKRKTTSNASLDDSSQDSVMSSVSASLESKKKIHAQRKFAQGCSGPSTPSTTPNKKSPISPHSLLERVPKTEDFLTFLCLRGSHLLPANLDFFHFARDESALEENGSDLRTPVHGECDDKNDLARECTPDSYSSSGCSNMNDELKEITSPITTPSKLVQDSRKAARASAGTPETARGIVSLRHGLTRKVVCPGRAPSAQHSRKYLFTTDSSLSPSNPRLAFGDFMPAKKSASINCLSASFLRSSPAGRLALERNGNLSAHPSSPGLTQCRPPSTSSSLPGKVKDSCRGLEQKQRLPTEAFTPVEHLVTRGRTETRSSNMSPVRKILEGASKKLQKSQNTANRPDPSLQQKIDKLPNKSREDRAKKREKLLAELSEKERIRKKLSSARKLIKRAPARVPLRPKRRSSLRLKTLAKILGRKRPNYSLVVSGYADMQEYEEEQKKKAAKTALAKAKAKARAKSSSLTTRSSKSSKPTEPEKMRTRSSSTISKDADEKRSEDLGVRDGIQRDKRRLCEKETAVDQERDCSGVKTERTAKRSLSTSGSIDSKRKDPPVKAAPLDSKRPKREGAGGGEAEKRSSASCSVSRPDSQESTTYKSTHISGTAVTQDKRVAPKKSAEKCGVLSSASADQVSRDKERVPVFHPTDEEFLDPITYIENIRNKAEPFGMCLIVPPASWKMESKVNEEIRFTTQVQHLHRLFKRWGPSVEQTKAIVHHLEDVDNSCTSQIGGVEVDLPQLFKMIHDLGGLQNIVDKKQWIRVAEAMKIPKTAHDRVTRLYDVYCKFVLPYAMLCDTEREQTRKDVLMQYESSSTEDDAIFKGKSMTLGTFSRIARNVQSMWFRDDPSPEMVEAAYWKIVEGRKSHVSVQCAHVNTRTQSTAFPTRRESPYYRHRWNLNNVPDNKQCILKCLGPVSGTTIPTLHVGMLFSTSCWSTDPHRLPYIHYLHSGANTIWYCIPKSSVTKFHEAMKELCPTLIHKCPLWLSEDTAMLKPEALKARGVDVVRCVQQPRHFVVVFPDVYTATVCCGYSVSESVHYATTEWLSVSMQAAKALRNSEEKELFSVDTLICGLCQDSTDVDTLTMALPMLQDIVARELDERHHLSAAGLKCERRLAVEDSPGTSASVARKRSHDLAEDSACDVCYKICYLSMVVNEHDEQILCLEHGLKHVERKRHVKAAKLYYRYTEEELTELVQSTKERLASLQAAKSSSSAALFKKRQLKKQDSQS